MPLIRNREGQRFGFLTAIRCIGVGGFWELQCICGTTIVRRIYGIDRPNSTIRSCGCKKHELISRARLIHGFTLSNDAAERRTYRSWSSMRNRCYSPNDKDYKNYGGRGITVCDRWQDFRCFVADLGLRPKGMSLGRINNDGPYSPENCRWEHNHQQNYNKRTTSYATLNGIRRTVREWSKQLCVSYGMVQQRLRAGWPEEVALLSPSDRSIKRYKRSLQ